MFKKLASRVVELHRDERGAEALEKILIFAAIAIPLLGVLIFFRGKISELLGTSWSNMTGQGDPTQQTNPDISTP